MAQDIAPEIFSEDQVEQDVLTRKPVCYVIIGKPGAGKTTLAKKLAALWKCQLVDGTTTIEQAIRDGTALGGKAEERLLQGENLEESFVMDIVLEKLNSPEIKHYGYVLDGLPTSGQYWKSVTEQIQLLQDLDLPPDIIINLKIPDQDLKVRRMGQKVDPVSGELFIDMVYNPPHTASGGAGEEIEEEEEEGEEEEGEDKEMTEKKKKDEFEDDLVELDSLQHRATEIVGRLVCRPEDSEMRVKQDIQYYREAMLRSLEDYIIQHNQQHVIELDANLAPRDLFRALLVRLMVLGVPRMPAPCRLVNPEEGDEEDGEESESVDTDSFMQQLSGTGCLMPWFRWRRSQWGKLCPVQLAAGHMTPGHRQFSVGFLDKMYCLSSSEALVKFTRNPRAYLLSPQPRVPCKVCVIGPPTSGKTTLAKILAQHYKAMVLDISILLESILADAKEDAVREAIEEAKSSAIAEFTQEISEQQEESGNGEVLSSVVEVSTDDPRVVQVMKDAESKARKTHLPITTEMYIRALKKGIQDAEQKRREADPTGPLYGGWVVDGFPFDRDHWATMIDQELLPDSVVTLTDEDATADYLLTRFTQMNGLPDPSTFKGKKKPETGNESSPEGAELIPKTVEDWQKKRGEYQRELGPLIAAIKTSSIDPISLDCTHNTTELKDITVQRMESVFEYHPVEYDPGEEEADMDNDPLLDTGTDDDDDAEKEEADDGKTKKQKPWGETSYFCPVALKELGVLWPGSEEHALRYRERLYYFSSDENKQKFIGNFKNYLSSDRHLKTPPVRVLLLGARGSGKTEVGRRVASSLGVFHVALRDYLQEQLLAKMKRPPLIHEDEWDPGDDGDKIVEEEKGNDDLDEDVQETLTEQEEELRAYLLHGEALSEESIDKYTGQFWDTEPYKSIGFIMEGFPSNADEIQSMAFRGRFPDTVIIMQVEAVDVVQRLLARRFSVWKSKKEKRLEKKARAKENKIKEWEEEKQKRKAELTSNYEAKVAARREMKEARLGENVDEDEDEEDEIEVEQAEYEEQLAELEAEEMEEEEEEEEEEEDAEAKERMRVALTDQYEIENETINSLQDTFVELQIPCTVVNASRKIPVVEYSLKKTLAPFTTHRAGLLSKCTPIDLDMAKKLLDHGYKQLSKFKRWCPVELSKDPSALLPPQQKGKEPCPVIYGPRIYYPGCQNARDTFMANPEHYTSVPSPGPAVPIRVAVVGPPKSGKSTVAVKLCDRYRCLRLSIGEAMRRVIAQFPHSELSLQLMAHLQAGETIPDELSVLALDCALLDVQCTTRGYVLDGWPLTKSQMDLLTKHRIIPVIIIELQISDDEMLRRAQLGRNSPKRSYPVHDSANILLVHSANYHKHVESVREWYSTQHHNWLQLDGQRSQWWVWDKTRHITVTSAQQIQNYLVRITSGCAAALSGLCITPAEFEARLGEFSHYCPVNLAQNMLVNCSHELTLQYSAEFRGLYYKMQGQSELEVFLHNPEQYVSPAPHALPPPDMLPVQRSQSEVKAMFPKKFEIQGFCPVTYVNGKRRYEFLVAGSSHYAAEYKTKLYCFASETHLDQFMRQPHLYEVTSLPAKLPPPKQPMAVTSLPLLGYLEQSVANSVINGLSAVGAQKPKYPFLSSTNSALIYLAYHLKAYNPKSNDYVRSKYKKKLAYFEEKCRLIPYLSSSMKSGYHEPCMRPIDFDHKIGRFLGLKQYT